MSRINSIFRLGIGFTIFIILAGISGWITLILMTSGGDVYVPDIVGKSLKAALSDLQSNHLYLVLDGEETHAEAPRGAIIAQNPASGAMRKAFSTVRVIISAGPNRLEMPDLRGYGIRQARLEAAELINGAIHEHYLYHKDYSEGEVIAHIPGPGEIVIPDGNMSLLISTGNRKTRYMMPDVIGLTISETKGILQLFQSSMDLIISERKEFGPGIIVDQDPEPGTPIELGYHIQLTVTAREIGSLGPSRFSWKAPPGLLSKSMIATYTVKDRTEILVERDVAPSEEVIILVPETGMGVLEITLDGTVVFSELR
ncbi:PASTA domain-containing protein [bacterium]|nr:PASTA domain-containing protein [candidate division CSSED10-310 bacterium]